MLKKYFDKALTAIASESLSRLECAGIFSCQELVSLMMHMPDSEAILIDELGLDISSVLSVSGFSKWPGYEPLPWPEEYVLSGALPPQEEWTAQPLSQLQGKLDRLVSSSPRPTSDSPSSMFLTDRYSHIRDQGQIGSCHSFATAAAWEGSCDSPRQMSPAFVFWGTKELDGIESDGSHLSWNRKALLKYGICFEDTHPYRADREYLRSLPPSQARREALELRKTMQSCDMVPSDDVQALKSILSDKQRAIAHAIPFFSSTINSPLFRETGEVRMRLGSRDEIAGGHAMCLVGYADNDWLVSKGLRERLGGGCFLVRNSWGTSFAPNNDIALSIGIGSGYAIIPYAYIEQYSWEALCVSIESSPVPQPKKKKKERDKTPKKRKKRSPRGQNILQSIGNWWDEAVDIVAKDSEKRIDK